MNLDWEPTPINEPPSGSSVGASLRLLGASVEGQYLVLRLAERLPRQSSLAVHLDNLEPQEIGADQWSQTNDNNVRVALTQEILAQLERPVLVTIEVVASTGRLYSNPMLVHHLRALSRASQPLRRRDRPHIPEGMEPESYEHCAQILDMLTDLLASNTEQLNRHRGRTVAYAREERLARQMELEEGYNPEDHFVGERVRVAATLSGGDLYADYDDRMTYEELLRAVLAAVYQPSGSIDEMARHSTEGTLALPPSVPQPLPTDAELLGYGRHCAHETPANTRHAATSSSRWMSTGLVGLHMKAFFPLKARTQMSGIGTQPTLILHRFEHGDYNLPGRDINQPCSRLTVGIPGNHL